jgi:hypothetical protein
MCLHGDAFGSESAEIDRVTSIGSWFRETVSLSWPSACLEQGLWVREVESESYLHNIHVFPRHSALTHHVHCYISIAILIHIV